MPVITMRGWECCRVSRTENIGSAALVTKSANTGPTEDPRYGNSPNMTGCFPTDPWEPLTTVTDGPRSPKLMMLILKPFWVRSCPVILTPQWILGLTWTFEMGQAFPEHRV